jgi:hypothetical protein
MPISVYYETKLSYLITCYLALHNLGGTILPHEKICRLIRGQRELSTRKLGTKIMKRRGEGERKGKDVSFRGGQILESK